jgi:hypothetical protein
MALCKLCFITDECRVDRSELWERDYGVHGQFCYGFIYCALLLMNAALFELARLLQQNVIERRPQAWPQFWGYGRWPSSISTPEYCQHSAISFQHKYVAFLLSLCVAYPTKSHCRKRSSCLVRSGPVGTPFTSCAECRSWIPSKVALFSRRVYNGWRGHLVSFFVVSIFGIYFIFSFVDAWERGLGVLRHEDARVPEPVSETACLLRRAHQAKETGCSDSGWYLS